MNNSPKTLIVTDCGIYGERPDWLNVRVQLNNSDGECEFTTPGIQHGTDYRTIENVVEVSQRTVPMIAVGCGRLRIEDITDDRIIFDRKSVVHSPSMRMRDVGYITKHPSSGLYILLRSEKFDQLAELCVGCTVNVIGVYC